MVEELVQIMVSRMGLPENQVKKFMEELFANVDEGTITLDTVREKTSDLLLDVILDVANDVDDVATKKETGVFTPA